jgi:hypothetical protein
MSWEWDNDKENRKKSANYYGYTPSNLIGKLKVFLSLFSLSAFNLLTRTMACVLFYVNGGLTGTAGVLGSELFIYLAIKGLRRDLWYWLPIYGVMGVLTSFLTRTMIKVVSDWTAVVQFRHPNEVGGAYFTFSLFLTIFMGAGAALQYEQGDRKKGLSKRSVLTIMFSACAGIVLSYAVLLSSIKKKYLYTFMSLKTSCQKSQDSFKLHEEDHLKFEVFGCNRYKWEYKIGEPVKAWLNERLSIWVVDPPEWFNDQKMSIIPDDMVIDKGILQRLRGKGVQTIIEQRRRSFIIGGRSAGEN